MKNIAKIEVCEIDGTSYEGLNRPIEFQHNALEEINVIAPWGYLPAHNLRIIVSVGCWVLCLRHTLHRDMFMITSL